MAGPSCSILYAKSAESDRLVGEFFQLVTDARDGNDFIVSDTRPIDGNYVGGGRPFLLFAAQSDADSIAEITQVLGWRPDQEIGLAAMCNRPEDHRILAEMARWLADRLSGYVDLGGELDFPVSVSRHAYLIPYETAAGWDSHTTLLSPTALAKWLRCPQFQMVK